ALLRPGHALHHQVVVEIERAGAQADGDLARTRLEGLRSADGDMVEAAAGGDVDGPDGHGSNSSQRFSPATVSAPLSPISSCPGCPWASGSLCGPLHCAPSFLSSCRALTRGKRLLAHC